MIHGVLAWIIAFVLVALIVELSARCAESKDKYEKLFI